MRLTLRIRARLAASFILVTASLLARTVQAQPAFVRVIGSNSTSTSQLAIPISVAIPRASTILISRYNFFCVGVTVTDSRANKYTSEADYCNNGMSSTLYRGYVATPLQPGDSILIAFQGPIDSYATAFEFRGLRDARVDAGQNTGGTSNGAFSTFNSTTNESGELLFGYILRLRQDGGSVPVAPEPSWTTLADSGSLLSCFKVAPTAGPYSFSGTVGGVVDAFFTAQWGAFRSFTFGDITGNAVVDVFDVVTLSSAIVGNVSPGTAPFSGPFAAGDVNRDGVLDVFDIVLLMGFIVGNVPSIPT